MKHHGISEVCCGSDYHQMYMYTRKRYMYTPKTVISCVYTVSRFQVRGGIYTADVYYVLVQGIEYLPTNTVINTSQGVLCTAQGMKYFERKPLRLCFCTDGGCVAYCPRVYYEHKPVVTFYSLQHSEPGWYSSHRYTPVLSALSFNLQMSPLRFVSRFWPSPDERGIDCTLERTPYQQVDA